MTMKMTSPDSSTTFNDPYLAQTDAAELKRMQDLAGVQGYGDSLVDESTEFVSFLGEMGVTGEVNNGERG